MSLLSLSLARLREEDERCGVGGLRREHEVQEDEGIGGAAVAGRQVRLEARPRVGRESAVEVFGDELDELLAAEVIRFHFRGTPPTRAGPSSERDGAVPVDSSR